MEGRNARTAFRIYLHYVFDLWVDAWRKKCTHGDVVVVRYADDNVLGFQYRADADRFLTEFRERLGKFGLELHGIRRVVRGTRVPRPGTRNARSADPFRGSSTCVPHPDKTRRIEFGRFAERDRKRRGEGKPDFLGFTHISGKDRNGNFAVKRHTIGKRMRGKLPEIKQQLRQRMHEPAAETGKWLKSVVQGYFNYHAVPGNTDTLRVFRSRQTRLRRWLPQKVAQRGKPQLWRKLSACRVGYSSRRSWRRAPQEPTRASARQARVPNAAFFKL